MTSQRIEHELQKTYEAQKQGYWIPEDKRMSLTYYMWLIHHLSDTQEGLDSAENNLQVSPDDIKYFDTGECKKCILVKALGKRPELEMKMATITGAKDINIHFASGYARRLTTGHTPIILSRRLLHDFVRQSWIERRHIDHVRDYTEQPGLAAVWSTPTLTNYDNPLKPIANIAYSFLVIDGSHRAAYCYRNKLDFSAIVLSPLEALQSTIIIDNKVNPLFNIDGKTGKLGIVGYPDLKKYFMSKPDLKRYLEGMLK